MEHEKVNTAVIRAFYLFGIGGLIAWNAILSDMDFFTDNFENKNPSFVFPNMNFILSVVFQFILICCTIKITYKTQIIGSFAISIVSLVSLPLVVKFIGGSSGFVVSCCIILFQGLANAVGLSSLYGIVSYLPLQCIIAMSTGQGFAGILMNVVRYITLFAFFSGDLTDEQIKNNKFYESLIFFSFSALVCVACLVCSYVIYENEYFQEKLQNSNEFKNVNPSLKINTQFLDDTEKSEESEKIKLRDSVKNSKEESIFPYLWDLSTLIFINYVITFSVFPGAALANELFGMSAGFRVNTLITVFNVFDSIGRFLPNYVKTSKNQLSFFIFLRLIFLFSYPILIRIERDSQPGTLFGIIVLIQMALLALSNGFTTTVAFSLAPQEVPEHLIGKSGSCISFFLICGIAFGAMFALFVTQSILI